MAVSKSPLVPTDPSFLAGEVHALVVFAQMLASMPVLSEKLLEVIDAAHQAGLDRLSERDDSRSLTNGFLFAMDQIRRCLNAAVQSSSPAEVVPVGSTLPPA